MSYPLNRNAAVHKPHPDRRGGWLTFLMVTLAPRDLKKSLWEYSTIS